MKYILVVAVLCTGFCAHPQGKSSLYNEPYRPQFHFTPSKNWMNDPNGLVYFNGKYHLFYQYNPYANTWGHMSWGHATSNDLVHWKHLPLAIPEVKKNMIFSGSCVIDKNNTTGFATKAGQVPMVAVYTAHIIPDTAKPDDYWQNQHIAYSLDNGITWTKYENNPVLDIHKKDFRDPKVFWHQPTKKWIMALVLPKEHIAQLYSSPDLKQWAHLSDFGPAGDTNDIWECQDLLQVPVEGSPGKLKWVLINSQQTAMQYFVGDFDGTTFFNENPADKILRPDYGPDYYAGITYNNLPANHSPVLLGWANNWTYAQSIPTSPWRSMMSLPRKLSVMKEGDTWFLLTKPVDALQKLRSASSEWKNVIVTDIKELPVKSQLLEMEVSFTPVKNSTAGIRLAIGNDKGFIIGYNDAMHQLFIDRSHSGDTSFNHSFGSWLHSKTSLEPVKGKITLHIFFDKSIIEIYGNGGRVAMTAQLFPRETDKGIELFSENGTVVFDDIKIWKMRSSWH